MNSADTQRVRETGGFLSVTLLLTLCALAPALRVTSDLPFFKVEQLFAPVIILLYLWLLFAGIARPIRGNLLFAIGILFLICNAVSIWYGGAILGHQVILRDFYELPKALLPVAFFTIAYEAELSEEALRRVITVFSLAILPVCLYGWAQFAGLSFTYKLNSLYSGGGHIDLALQYAGRVYATMGNANVLGQLLTWCTLLFVLCVLFQVGNRLWNLLVAFACVVTLVMTGSRYGLVNLAIGFVLLLGIVLFAGRKHFFQLAALVVLAAVFAWTFQTVAATNVRTLARYQTLKAPLQIDSLRQRLDDVWQQEWKDFSASPLFGHGPAKSFYTSGFADSEYLGVLREKGLIGFLVFLGYYLFPLERLARAERWILHHESEAIIHMPANAVVIHAGLIMGLLALVMNLGMSTFYSPFLQGFLWLWLGLGVRSAASALSHQSQLAFAKQTEISVAEDRRATPPAFRATPRRVFPQSGMTLLELVISCAILLILSSMALPVARYSLVREKENKLRTNLQEIRDAIDHYKELSDQRRLKAGIGSYGYPPDLNTLVKGVPLADARGEGKSIRFLRRIPEDPMTGNNDWGLRAVEDEKNSTNWNGKDVFDVYSKSTGTASDGTRYSDW